MSEPSVRQMATPPAVSAPTPTPPGEMTHAEWWNSDAASVPAGDTAAPIATYTDAQAMASLVRAGRAVLVLTLVGLPVAWYFGGSRSALALLVGAAVSGSGLWEWRRLMAALTARMDAAETVQATTGASRPKTPSIAFAVLAFTVRLLVVLGILYGSLSYLHGSVAALAAGLAMGVLALTIEAVRLLRSGTI